MTEEINNSWLNDMKYIDLHFHLDGSITPEIAEKLAELQQIDLGTKDHEEITNKFVSKSTKNLREFLKRFRPASELLQTKEGISEAVYLVQEEFKKIGGVYLEIRFAPQFHCFKGLTQEEVIQAALDGLKRSDLKCNLILCIMRKPLSEKRIAANNETFELAKKYLAPNKDGKYGVVGIDIAGDEKSFPIAEFKEYFIKAKELGIPFTIHAGESDGSESIENSLNLGAKRIGHGIRCIDDEKVMERLKNDEIFLEICPYSNFCTNSMQEEGYPLRQIYDKGIKVTINTDDKGIVDTNMRKEFDYIVNKLNFTKEECKKIYLNSVDAAFLNEEDKAELRKENENL